MKINKIKKNNGFTLLFASLIVSLLLAVGLAILNITLQQLLLSSNAKESQFAFYNADTGIECATYHDKNNPNGKTFATSSDSTDYISQPTDITCNGVNPTDVNVLTDPEVFNPTHAETDFDLIWISPGQCSETSGPHADKLIHVQVIKSADNGNINTEIKARGYNSCDPANPRRVERGFLSAY